MHPPLHIAVRFSLHPQVYFAIAEGMLDYVRRQLPRRLVIAMQPADLSLPDLAKRPGIDGLIVTLRDPAACAQMQRLRRPVVNVVDQFVPSALPTVCPDDIAVGARGAAHLLACGFRRLCYLGWDSPWSNARQKGFLAAAAGRGVEALTMADFPTRRPITASNDIRSVRTMRRVIAALPERCGVMAGNDQLASQLVEVALRAGRRVPDALAVLGTDNVAVLCDSAPVPITSIPLDYRRIGAEALGLLDRQIQGTLPPRPLVLVPPQEVVRRRSTDAIVYEEPDVAAAVRHIRSHAAEGISVAAVVRHLAVSRTRLDLLFRRHVGHTPAEELRRARLEIARRLLLETDLPLMDVAQRSGFCSQSHFTLHFRKAFGQPPRRFRAQATRR